MTRLGSVLRSRSVVLVAACTAAAALGACGGSGGSHSPERIHMNGNQAGDYVSEISASGTEFLVPVSTVARQSGGTFEVESPRTANMTSGPGQAGAGPWGTQPVATGIVPRSARVELLATGASGLRFALGWEDTCGFLGTGKRSSAGLAGGQGRLALVSPAVVILKLPNVNPGTNCYIAASAWARAHSNLRLSVIDYYGSGQRH